MNYDIALIILLSITSLMMPFVIYNQGIKRGKQIQSTPPVTLYKSPVYCQRSR